MNRKRLRRGVEALWEAADEALWGEGTTREERASLFGAMMREAVARGECGNRKGEPTLGERLKALRLEQGMTPSRASRQAGLEASAWRSWEASHRVPSVRELRRVAGLLGPGTWRELSRLRRRAPAACLARALATPSPFRVARSVGDGSEAQEAAVLEVRNLDPHLRQALETWCRETRGTAEETVLADALERARSLDEVEREGWIQAVCAGVQLEEEERT